MIMIFFLKNKRTHKQTTKKTLRMPDKVVQR